MVEVVDSKKCVDKLGCIPSDETCSSGSNVKISRLYSFEWTISDYSFFKCLPEGATSPDFKVGHYEADIMKIRLSPASDSNYLTIDVSLQGLYNKSDLIAPSGVKYQPLTEVEFILEFLDFNGKILDYFTEIPNVSKSKFYNSIKEESASRFLQSKYYNWTKVENVSRFVENDSLKIRAKLCLKYCSAILEKEPSPSKSLQRLIHDMKKLVGGNFSPDLTVKVAGKRFLVHKCILLPQFAFVAKLYSEFKDFHSVEEPASDASKIFTMDEKVVCIPDETTEVFEYVLDYLYTGNICTEDSFNDFELYKFAQRHQLNELGRHLKPSEMNLRTQTKKAQLGFYWHVKEYSVLSLDKFNLFHSPAYKIRVGEMDISWSISLFIFDSNSIFLSLEKVEGIDVDTHSTFRLMVCNPDGTPHEERAFTYRFGSKMPTSYPGFLDPESRFSISPRLLFDDMLILRCEITTCDGQLTSFTGRIYPGEPSIFDFKIWLKNLQNLLETGNFSDVSLIVEEKVFKVHKAILSARSPVFATMFETNMAEKLNGSVKIEDISCATMKCALTYIYTGTLDVLTIREAPELYRTAEKYELLELKERCVEFILGNLDPDNACEVLILSDLFGDMKMKESAKNVICRNAGQSLLTDFGQELMMHHPQLAHDVLDNLSAVFCSLPPQDAYAVDSKFALNFQQ